MSTGDVIAIVAVIVAIGSFLFGLAAAQKRDLESAESLLTGVLAAMAYWGDLYFGTPYASESIEERAQRDRQAVLDKRWIHLFEVPTEPVAALVSGAPATAWISAGTIEEAGLALWQMRILNELIRQHTDQGRQPLAEIADPELPQPRRDAIATAAYQQSATLHASIGTGAWYGNLTAAIGADLERMQGLIHRNAWTIITSVWSGDVAVMKPDPPAHLRD